MEGVKMKVITKNKLIPFYANPNSKNELKLETQFPLQPLLKLIDAEHQWHSI